jgi:serine/threonine protein kinase
MASEEQEYTGLDKTDAALSLYRSGLYTFDSEVLEGIWTVRRNEDGTQYLARDVTKLLQQPNGMPSPLTWLMDPKMHDLTMPMTGILNHPNLVNFVDYFQARHTSNGSIESRPASHYFLWDFCNAGTLENLFCPEEAGDKRKGYVRGEQDGEEGAHSPKSTSEPNAFLPESLIWHVLNSLLRALSWLHHGVRFQYNGETERYERLRADVDWQTILHRNIEPSNIFFCHPLHGETYGLCKLGNFSTAFVSGHVNGVLGGIVSPGEGKVLAGQEGHVPLEQLRVEDKSLNGTFHHPPRVSVWTHMLTGFMTDHKFSGWPALYSSQRVSCCRRHNPGHDGQTHAGW